MFLLMRRLLATCVLALLVFCALAGAALAKTPKPTVTSISPAQVPVGGTLVLKGKNFASGASHNRVFFSRATDGKTVRARPRKASKTRIEVVVPPGLTKFLVAGKATRFQVAVFTKLLGSKTSKSRSPIVLPAGATPTTPGGTPTVTTPPPPPPDCDADGTPDATDADDDNDGLTDDVEAAIHTNSCNKDTDGDGIGDAYEYYSSLDLNGSPNYAGKRPYPNPLDAGDAQKDFDGDGLTQADEYAASVKYGTATSAPLTYSDGNQQSVASPNQGAMDLDNNGRITDDEKDADNDKLPNWTELAKGEPGPHLPCHFAPSTGPYGAFANAFTDCGGGLMPNGFSFGDIEGTTLTGAAPPPYDSTNHLDWLDPDSDGDGTIDGDDDLDFDGVSNIEEITAGTDGYYTVAVDPCDPNPDSRSCPVHPSH
jgi:Bacterial TSP3 repeat/IPT/TIG domain